MRPIVDWGCKQGGTALAATVLLVALIGSGCASSGGKGTWTRSGDPLLDGLSAVEYGPAKDKTLWQYRTALVALRRGEFVQAKSLLDDAIVTLGGISAGDDSARKARGYFHEESKKSFRGEPYERVMAFYYRGLLYWMDGEPDNARACFRSAQLEDSDTENKEYASDYVLLEYLDGLATFQLGGDPADRWERARKAARLHAPPVPERVPNTLFFIEFGRGPTKYASGEHREQLRFRPGQSQVKAVRITIDGQSYRVGPYDDLSFQATTRGGRVMDHILANKAVFKSATDGVGNAAILGGAVVGMTSRRNQEVALGLVAAGLVSKLISAATTPAADTRSWDNLPQYLSFAAFDLAPGDHATTVEFLDSAGYPLTGRTRSMTVRVPHEGDAVLFVSDQS